MSEASCTVLVSDASQPTARNGFCTRSMCQFLVKPVYLSLLAVANAAVVVMMHHARTRSGPMFLSSAAVVMGEVVKVAICVVITFAHSPCNFFSNIYGATCGNLKDWVKVALPALLYAVQNNLTFFAVSVLSAVEFQVMYQLKILTTALFSVVWLRKQLNYPQWTALVLLFIGVAIVQTKGNFLTIQPTKSRLLATGAVVLASILSGFSSVYFEGILKNGEQTVWVRNIQLGVPAALFSSLTMVSKDYEDVSAKGMFYGFDMVVILVVLLQSVGGLLVALVISVTDNVIKTFAMAVAIVLSGLASAFLFHVELTPEILSGSCLVIVAVIVYGINNQR